MPIPTLIAGPYHTPKLRRQRRALSELDGIVLSRMELHQGPHPILGITGAPIPWPWTRVSGTMRQLIVTAELERAIRTESVQAVAHWWGVSRWWVERARRKLGVERMNPGTSRLWSELAASRLGDGIYHVGSRTPKLTQRERDKLRSRAAKGESRVKLAREFGVTRQYVSMLVKGRRSRAGRL